MIFAEQYEKLNGKSFAQFITTYFNDIFFRSGKNVKRWLQDGDPSQNSALAKNAMKDMDAELFSIPPRSPELNPIENVFSFVKKELRDQVLENNIERESFQQFSLRVKATLYATKTSMVNSIISSYHNRLVKVILKKGGKIEY